MGGTVKTKSAAHYCIYSALIKIIIFTESHYVLIKQILKLEFNPIWETPILHLAYFFIFFLSKPVLLL